MTCNRSVAAAAFGILLAFGSLRAGEIPPIPATPDDVEVTFLLSDAAGQPGATGVSMYFDMASNTPMQGWVVAFTYDRAVLAAEEFELVTDLGGSQHTFVSVDLWAPPDATVQRHGCAMGVVVDFTQEMQYYYPFPDLHVARVDFAIAPDADPGTQTEVTFEDNVVLHDYDPGLPLQNYLVVQGESVPPEFGDGKVGVTDFVNGRIKILEEITIFIRGDFNRDRKVDVADAISTLGYLFVNEAPPSCPDAADANDDAIINVADPIAVLYTLFAQASQIGQPYPDEGADVTADALGPCIY